MECPHGMPSRMACTDCMYDGNVEPRPRPEADHVARTFEAQFDGECGGCNLPISAGQYEHRLEPSGRYVHAFQGCEP